MPNPGKVIFKFGSDRHEGLGTLDVRIRVDDNHFIETRVDVVDVDIPFLLGLEFLDLFDVVIEVAQVLLISRSGWEVPLTHRLGHLYICNDDKNMEMLYTEEELRKVHKHFFHPKSERLYAVLKRGDPESVTTEDLKCLEKLAKKCDVCQRYAAGPRRFRVSLPKEDVVFNRTLCIDLMFLTTQEGKPKGAVLHCVDKDTKFNAACFLPDQTLETVWRSYQMIWSLPYVGHPEHMHVDQGPQFESTKWEGLCNLSGITLTLSGVEEHNAIAEGERYHAYLRQVYKKVRKEVPGIDAPYALTLAVKAANDTAGPMGITPTLLVFGLHPKVRLHSPYPGMDSQSQNGSYEESHG